MTTSPSAAPTFPAALLQSNGGGGVMQKKLFTTGDASAEARAGVPIGQGSEPQSALLFSALLAATTPQVAQPGLSGLEQIELPADDALSRDAALAGLAVDSDDLLANLMATPGMIELSDAVAQFVDVLQQFDLATGGNATEVLVKNLAGLDAEGLARLDEAATDPASLVAALARLAGIPGAASPGAVASSSRISLENQMPGTVAPSAPVLISTQLRDGERTPSGRSGAPAVLTVPEIFPLQKQTASPAEPHFGVRAVVADAIVGGRTGAEREGVPLFATSVEARPVASSMSDIARPAEPGPPNTFGFARNVVQQIRGASFIDGHTRIALAPRGLGEIEIDMRADDAGKLRIVLRAENPAVLQALRSDRDGLLLALSDGGAGADDADLELEDFSRRQRRDSERADTSPDHTTNIDLEDTAPIIAPTPPIIGTGALDMLT